ncbi:RNA-binding protein 1-like [Canna indica]|uniref:RNA-binding protein 1-like n=1 Tax=Canna indica TaxID=4628 RepID=A0AAQ3QSR1_9LILI|nr:RNA-binding protein 1-like [Canna indica]
MADAYWRYADNRHQVAPAAAMTAPSSAVKRPRTEYVEIPGGPEILGYYPRDDERTGHRVIRDTEAIGASYDRYLRNGISSFGGEPVRTVGGGISCHPVDDRRMMSVGGLDSRTVGYGGGRPEPSLPPDASNTLFVEGLPANCTRREVSHIFRPFVGFREVRLVNKESRHPGADPLILCFVDFGTPAQAAVALEALQGDNDVLDALNILLGYMISLKLYMILCVSCCSVLFVVLNSLVDVHKVYVALGSHFTCLLNDSGLLSSM